MSESMPTVAALKQVTALATLRRAAELVPEFGKGLPLTVGLALVGGLGQLVVPVVLQNVIDRGLRIRVPDKAKAMGSVARKTASGSAVSVRFGQIALRAVAAIVTVVTQAARRASAYRLGT
jgi:hypothetical protein